jgi:hypothetical protein
MPAGVVCVTGMEIRVELGFAPKLLLPRRRPLSHLLSPYSAKYPPLPDFGP